MFRAARFVAQLGFRLAEGVEEAMGAMAHRASILSAERVRDELSRLLVSEHAREGMEVLRRTGLLEVWIPELLPMVGVEQGGWHLYDVWEHSLRAVELAPRRPGDPPRLPLPRLRQAPDPRHRRRRPAHLP